MRVRSRRFSSVKLKHLKQPGKTERVEESKRKGKRQSRAVRQTHLCLVDLELEASPDETSDTLHHSLPRPFTAYVDIAIIRVAREPVVAPLLLSIEFVEYQVRQQGRQHAPYTKGN